MGHALKVINEVRGKIAADAGVLAEARKRRNAVTGAARQFVGALRTFNSGSVAHGTVNSPVTDADAGLVLDRRSYPQLGPEGSDEGPEETVDELAEFIGPIVRKEYPKAKMRRSRRGLFITFNEELEEEQDSTVDLIVTLTRSEDDGLWIPDLDNDDWTPSHPEKHTELFTAGTQKLRTLRARVTRLAKAWNKQWDEGDRILSSFNIEALAWEYVEDEDQQLDEVLAGFFAYARDEISKANTKDPAGVSEPIRLLLDRATCVSRLGEAADALANAIEAEDETTAREWLSTVYPDYVDSPNANKRRLAVALSAGNAGIGATKSGIVVGGGTPMKTPRSWGGEWRG